MALNAGVDVPHRGLWGQVQLELRKATDTRSELAITLLPALVSLLALAGALVLDRHLSLRDLLAIGTAPQSVLLPVVGVRAAASDWGYGSLVHAFMQNSRRHEVLLAKLGALAVIAALTWVAVFVPTEAAYLFGHLPLGQVRPTSVPGTFAAIVLVGLFGVVLGAAVRSERWGYLLIALMGVTGLPQVVSLLGPAKEYLSLPHALTHLMDGELFGLGSFLVVLAIWLVVPGAYAFHRWRHDDVGF